ncbi:hypothetical protein GIY23_02325 [Allosaccharopolyspora coralli]|uniref:Uncharacterized protein n=1 Tax=Allosaccharopolyspora coralli TaxID=2665642 RepID=A0A5Q3Q4X1_9PSEU|nr:hypothetical protein [Allosaccharopolyspora coralli]QGK68546.1 hypothetical protein GIY23_02325 [Allosaccharopolyspora coralli]
MPSDGESVTLGSVGATYRRGFCSKATGQRRPLMATNRTAPAATAPAAVSTGPTGTMRARILVGGADRKCSAAPPNPVVTVPTTRAVAETCARPVTNPGDSL